MESGDHHSLILSEDNKLYSLGENIKGQLGLGHNNNNVKSTQFIESFKNKKVKNFACGKSHSLVLTKEDGALRLYSFGYNSYGQLGLGNNTDQHSPMLIKSMEN